VCVEVATTMLSVLTKGSQGNSLALEAFHDESRPG